ncbi:MAG: hypothetical protein GY952_01355 [Rhodobacteraceae bacterium]|nr:hypothetical protein [Paracoccaceae bacterium]
MPSVATRHPKPVSRYIPDMPLVVWMVFITIGMGLAGGMPADNLIATFNAGFGRALGEFALILLPSFVLAAAMSRRQASLGKGLATVISPVAGASMICPDTAYAAISPIAGHQKLNVAFGSYAGFKLLYPAGPLIVATGLGVSDPRIPLFGFALLIPVFAASAIWVRAMAVIPAQSGISASAEVRHNVLRSLAPFLILALLLVIGAASDFATMPLLEFITLPKGALLIAATLALLDCPVTEQRACLDSSVSKTGSLLLVIGTASALGSMLTSLVPVGDFVPPRTGVMGILGLFALTAVFKLTQGSSMATFAAVAPVAAPVVASSDMSPTAAVFAICLGSFIAILPNDSFYWLVRRDALEETSGERRAIWVLTGGALVQALAGLALVVILVVAGII